MATDSLRRGTDTTKDVALYMQAARDVENDPLLASCCAVTYCVSSSIAPLHCPEALRYVEAFSSLGMMSYGYEVTALPEEERQDYRVLALCFMAAMVEAGDA